MATRIITNMTPYIVFTGSHSTGKSSLVKELIKVLPYIDRFENLSIYHIVEVSRKLNRDLNIPINKEGTSNSQRLIEEVYKKEEESHSSEIKVADRSIIDRFAYTITSKAADDKELVQWYKDNIKKICSRYDYIFYIPILIPLSLDGVRSADEAYRKEIDHIIVETIKEFNIPIYTIPFPEIDERLNYIIEVLNRGANV